MIERRVADVEQVLVCSFGSTPILAPDYKSAMCLAKYCNVDKPSHGLRWIDFAPADCEGAIEFARERRIDEALDAIGAHPVNLPDAQIDNAVATSNNPPASVGSEQHRETAITQQGQKV
jgi:hypothetical protein